MQDPASTAPQAVRYPDTFDGRFYFTNYTNEDFTDKWNGVEYTFPAMKTSPIIIPTESMEATQAIRKKFARTLAEREFFKSARLAELEGQNPVGQGTSIHTAATYTEKELTAYIQKCLEPLPIASAVVRTAPKDPISLRTDDEGNPVTKVLKSDKESLLGENPQQIA